jgi:hypothetical protein
VPKRVVERLAQRAAVAQREGVRLRLHDPGHELERAGRVALHVIAQDDLAVDDRRHVAAAQRVERLRDARVEPMPDLLAPQEVGGRRALDGPHQDAPQAGEAVDLAELGDREARRHEGDEGRAEDETGEHPEKRQHAAGDADRDLVAVSDARHRDAGPPVARADPGPRPLRKGWIAPPLEQPHRGRGQERQRRDGEIELQRGRRRERFEKGDPAVALARLTHRDREPAHDV